MMYRSKMTIALLVVFCHSSCLWIYGQGVGLPSIRHFSSEVHMGGGQNYMVTQSPDGVIYIGNNLGLLSFDGSHWSMHSIDGGTKVRSVLATEDGKIYVGGQNELGYFHRDAQGFLIYVSLTSLLPASDREFEDIWKINYCGEDICFSATGVTFILKEGRFYQVPSLKESSFVFSLHDTLITLGTDGGMLCLQGTTWVECGKTEMSDGMMLAALLQLKDGKRLWLTRFHGILQSHGSSQIPFDRDLQEELSRSDITDALELDDGVLAISTWSNGLFFVDSESGQLILHLNKDNGLQGRGIHDIYEDQQGSLWLGMNNKVIQVSWSYPYSFINENLNLPGSGYSASMYNNDLYLGTTNGLFNCKMTETRAPLSSVDGVQGHIYNLHLLDDHLIICAHDGLFRLDGHSLNTISKDEGWWIIVPTQTPNIYIGGLYDGLALLEVNDGSMQVIKKYPDFSESSRVMTFDDKGYLWMAHGYKGIYRFEFSKDYDAIEEVKYYNESHGLPSKYLNNVFKIKDEIIFTGSQGTYTFDYDIESFRNHEFLDELIGAQVHVRHICEGLNDDIIVITQGYTGVIQRDNWSGMVIDKEYFNGIHRYLNDDLSNVSVVDSDHIIFGANEGFIYFDDSGTRSDPLDVIVTSIKVTNNDSIIRGKYTSVVEDEIIELTYDDNSILFTYSIPEFRFDNSVYKYKLEGFYIDRWSDWIDQPFKEFTNLTEGEYTFHVKGKSSLGVISSVAKVEFTIGPPWYRSNAAVIIYALMILLVTLAGIYLYQKKYKREKSVLLANQKEELERRDRELMKIKNEKLELDNNQKKKELAASTLHLLAKNELIQKIKKGLNDLSHSSNVDKNVSDNIGKIIWEIDKNLNLDEDWHQFEINFDQVHGNFLRHIKSQYITLTPHDIKLCAYLRMNMSTKEIAKLLMITVRGVEIARYRLRKKLRLSRDVNLSEFIMTYDRVSDQVI